MQKPPLDPAVADTAPSDSVLTVYDEEHVITYLRQLDPDAKGADWREVTRVVLHLDPKQESDRARRAFESHLSRAKWRDVCAVLNHEKPLPHPSCDQAQQHRWIISAASSCVGVMRRLRPLSSSIPTRPRWAEVLSSKAYMKEAAN